MADELQTATEIFEVLGTQRAMRRLKPDPIPEELIKKVLWAATRAPSGGNRQGWRFVVVTDAEKKKGLQEVYGPAWHSFVAAGYGRMDATLAPEAAESNRRVMASATYLADHLHEAPVIIMACTFKAPGSVNQGIAEGASIYPAVQNLMLAARALGLGTALTTIHRTDEPRVREILGIPDTVDTAALIPLGWPKGRFGAGLRQPVETVTYWETWGNKRP